MMMPHSFTAIHMHGCLRVVGNIERLTFALLECVLSLIPETFPTNQEID